MVKGGLCFWMRDDLCTNPLSPSSCCQCQNQLRLRQIVECRDFSGKFMYIRRLSPINILVIADLNFQNHASNTYLTPMWLARVYFLESWRYILLLYMYLTSTFEHKCGEEWGGEVGWRGSFIILLCYIVLTFPSQPSCLNNSAIYRSTWPFKDDFLFSLVWTLGDEWPHKAAYYLRVVYCIRWQCISLFVIFFYQLPSIYLRSIFRRFQSLQQQNV